MVGGMAMVVAEQPIPIGVCSPNSQPSHNQTFSRYIVELQVNAHEGTCALKMYMMYM